MNDSAPCFDCHKTMKELGIKNIIYSIAGGEFIKIRCSNYEPKTVSFGKMFILGGYKPLKRDEVQEQKYGYIKNYKADIKSSRTILKSDKSYKSDKSIKQVYDTSSDNETISICSSISYQSVGSILDTE